MGLSERLTADLMDAMRARDRLRADSIRQVKATVTNAEIKENRTLDDAGIQDVVARLVRQHRESVEMFAKGGRPDLVDKETAELKVLEGYLPQQMGHEDLLALVRQAAAEIGATGPTDKGRLMGKLMPQLRGKADGKAVGEVVEQVLGKTAP